MANILLVDDDDDLRDQLEGVLRLAEHSVTTAANGKEALRLVYENAFDLVITDLVMPEKEGIETIMELRRNLPALKIVAMSGGGSVDPEDYLVLARNLGAAQTLAKPFTGKELLATVAGVLAQ